MSDYLPQEVLIEIFTRLPVKTLLQIRLVCRLWYSIISNPTFITAHINKTKHRQCHSHSLLLRHFAENERHKKEHYLLLSNENQTLLNEYNVELQFPFKTRSKYHFRIVGSCNGVLCLSDDYGDNAYGIILWNPSIRKYKSLPSPRVTKKTHGSYMFVLGFGFDSKSNDYKVVRVAYVKGRNGRDLIPPEVELYALSSGSWRGFNAGAPPYGIYGCTWSQAFVNGAVHWIGYDPCVAKGDCALVVSFDMSDEIFRGMLLPDSLVQCGWDLTVSVFGEMLSVYHYEYGSRKQFCSVWVMKEYGVIEAWTKLYSIDLHGGLQKLIWFRKNEEVILVTVRGKLITYDLNTLQMRGLGLRGAIDSVYVDNYMESLVLVEEQSAILGPDAITCEGGEEDREAPQWPGSKNRQDNFSLLI
ncbi:unnamed protein product [Ilex paraguariensis]|uniref:F-box domain-containing protein n=1 Tax=Ilex paraguariensis TaxID=185542 RepID=A0ABC8TNN8_9AQUA